MQSHVSMAPNGRLVIPAKIRSELGMERGGQFVVSTGPDGSLHLEPMRNVVARVQAEVAKYVPRDVSLADALSAERRAAADE